ncbi:MAG TPA: hypothetical protein VFO49_08320 [Nocardioides sp.]|nr:hypothetical protein [Nocardioides sp.]
MAERVVLHVGTMKSGTSYLQTLLFEEKPHLAEAGVLVPGATWSDQARAVRQALAPRKGGKRPRWTAFADEVRAAPGTAVISMEYLGPSGPETISTVLGALGVSEARVVVTARDLNRTLVSMWQETIQNGRTWTWAEYVADAEAKRPRDGARVADRQTPGGTFWRQQDLVRMVGDWSGVVGADNVVLTTVPRPGAAPTVLAERFVAASGVQLDASREVTTANESLGLASLLVLRRVNELLDERDLAFPAGQGVRKRTLAKTILAARRAAEPALGLSTPPWVHEQTERTVSALREAGTRLVGDWADLEPVDVPGVEPDDVPLTDVHEAALEAIAGLVADQVRRRG